MLRWLILIVFLPVLLTASPVEGEFSCNIATSEKDQERESAFQLNGNLVYEKKNLYVNFHPQVNYSFNDKDSTVCNATILGEYYFKWGGISIHSGASQSEDIYRKYLYGSAEVFRTIDQPQFIFEYGTVFSLDHYPDFDSFDHFDAMSYLIYKKFYRKHALHMNLDLEYRYLQNFHPQQLSMFRVSTSLFISRGLRQNIGLKYGLSLDHLITESDSLIYPAPDLYDIFAYNNYSLYLESTMYIAEFLLKPGLSFIYKEYAASTLEEDPYQSDVLFSMYMDYALFKGVLVFTNDWFSLALNDTKNSYFASFGIRYIF